MKRITFISLMSLMSLIGPIRVTSQVHAVTLNETRNQLQTIIPKLGKKGAVGGAVPGQLLVKFADPPTITYESEIAIPIPFTSTRIQLRRAGFAVRGNRAATDITKQLRVQGMRVLGQSDPAREIAFVQLPEGTDEQRAIEQYENTPGVEIAEPNYLMRPLWIPNDPYFQKTATQDYQWNLHAIRMPEAWDVPPRGGSPSVKVAVIDSGVAFATHTVGDVQYQQAPELSGVNFVAPRRFESLSGDCETPLPTPIVDEHPHDEDGHGTHVTGTIVQATNNAAHAAGIAHNISVIPIKVLTRCTSGPDAGYAAATTSDVIAGINYAVANGANVINMSIGTSEDSTILHNTIIAAVNAGASVVAATGNLATRGASLPIVYPAKYPEVIAVGATRFDGMRAAYSQYGPELDLTVPGGQAVTDAAIAGDITTILICLESAQTPEAAALCVFLDQNLDTLPDGIVQQTMLPGNPNVFTSIPGTLLYGLRCLSPSEGIDSSCGLYMGTSMATPHVAAAAALILSVNPNLTPAQVKDLLTSTASKTAIPGYTQTEHGAGLLDVMAALLAASGGTITPPASTPTPTEPEGTPTPRPTGWTTTEPFQLLVGDVNDTNTITIEDVSAVLSTYTDFKITVSDGTPVDVNADGFVTIEDVALVLLNYLDFTIPGEAP